MKWLMGIGSAIGLASLVPHIKAHFTKGLFLVLGTAAVFYISYEIEKYLLFTDNSAALFYLLIGRIIAHILVFGYFILWCLGLLPMIWQHLWRLLFVISSFIAIYYAAHEAHIYYAVEKSPTLHQNIILIENIAYGVVLFIYGLSYLIPFVIRKIRAQIAVIDQSIDKQQNAFNNKVKSWRQNLTQIFKKTKPTQTEADTISTAAPETEPKTEAVIEPETTPVSAPAPENEILSKVSDISESTKQTAQKLAEKVSDKVSNTDWKNISTKAQANTQDALASTKENLASAKDSLENKGKAGWAKIKSRFKK